ncbi:uncharacterized protein LOC100874906 [Megachile rotundata]|uniref:uncharacterized protein LOC100874906 n=1 Tax=Megachile rotundata TaxID=143995 RepID=UPI000258F351|nr:PREDICTED: uncharacterized protein C14orf80 homolog isoform X4 [Megachile rotundata]
MSDIKSVLSLLCQHVNLSTNVLMKPEYFRLAKFNNPAENIAQEFWKILNVLSYHIVKEQQIEIDFQHCDIVWATKLYFAYLQYPAIEFYALSRNGKNNRQLLLAFAWLHGTHNALSVIVRINLCNSVLGREFTRTNSSEKKETEYDIPESLSMQMNNILYLNGKVNYNIKEIAELVSEKVKLISKAHAASINVSGLPHLSVSELALIKRLSTINKKAPSNEDKKYLKELNVIGSLLDVHLKWLKKEHIFFEWMVTVVEEHNKSLTSSLDDINWNEISKFISILHSVTQEKFENLSSKKDSNILVNSPPTCVSRLLRIQDNDIEMENWLTELSTTVKKDMEDLSKKKEELSKELKEILKSMPSTIQVSFS